MHACTIHVRVYTQMWHVLKCTWAPSMHQNARVTSRLMFKRLSLRWSGVDFEVFLNNFFAVPLFTVSNLQQCGVCVWQPVHGLFHRLPWWGRERGGRASLHSFADIVGSSSGLSVGVLLWLYSALACMLYSHRLIHHKMLCSVAHTCYGIELGSVMAFE